MASKFDRLREGQVIDFKPGVKGRLNPQKKTLELSTGEYFDVSQDPDFFPSDESQLTSSRHREAVETGIAKSPFGEFGHQVSTQGLIGAGRDWINYATMGDQYAPRKMAEQEASERISRESPWTSAAATGTAMIPDLLLTRGLSAVTAAPVLTGLHAGPRIIEEPGQVAKEAALSAAFGKVLDIGGNWAANAAKRRGQIRALPGQQEAVRAQNLAGEEAVLQANRQQAQNFNVMKQDIKGINDARLKQYEAELLARKNKIITDTNHFKQYESARQAHIIDLKNKAEVAKVQRSANAAQLENDYNIAKKAAQQENRLNAEKLKIDQAQYQKDLARLPEIQKQAQAEYSANVVRNAENLSSSFPKGAKIYSSEFKPAAFIDESIRKSGMAATKEGNQAQKIIKSIFPEGEILTAQDLAQRYKSLEGVIQKSTPEVQGILNQFKEHMGTKLPNILASNMAYGRIVPPLKKQVEKDIFSTLKEIGAPAFVTKRAELNINQIFRELTPEDFLAKFQSGELRERIFKEILKEKDFSNPFSSLVPKTKKVAQISSEEAKRLGLDISSVENRRLNDFQNLFTQKLDNALAKAELKMIGIEEDAKKKLGAKLKGTLGVAEPVAPPQAPMGQPEVPLPQPPSPLPQVPPVQLPPGINAPQAPQLPAKPNLMAEPTPPTPQSFIGQPEPTLGPPSGFGERAGEFLEQNLLGSGKGMLNNPIAKLGGLKYLLGKAALPAEAAYFGLKGLTSPTAGGEIARLTFKQGGIQAIESWAQKYPSYNNGVLENPQERRSLTKEIENDPEIPIEQKAIIQSKVNRGQPLQQNLR